MRLLVPVLALCLALPAAAEEPPAAPASETPAQRVARVLAAFPAPDATQAWSFVGDMLVNGSPLGTMSFSMEAVTHEGRAAWKAVDEMQVGTPREGVHVRSEALLDAHLAAVSGVTVSEMSGEETVHVTWRREGATYRVERRQSDMAVASALESPGPRIVTLAAQVHLLRALPGAAAIHAVDELVVEANVGDDPRRRLRSVRIEAPAATPGPADSAPAPVRWRLTPSDAPERALTVSIDPAGRTLLGLEQPASKLVVRLRKDAAVAGDAPPRSATEAAMRAARALAVGDAAALGRVLNWATVDARLAKDSAFAGLEPQARRARLIERLDEQLAENPPQMIDMVLQGVADALELEDLGGGRTRVTFPPIFRSMKLVVVKVGDAWLLDDLPDQP